MGHPHTSVVWFMKPYVMLEDLNSIKYNVAKHPLPLYHLCYVQGWNWTQTWKHCLVLTWYLNVKICTVYVFVVMCTLKFGSLLWCQCWSQFELKYTVIDFPHCVFSKGRFPTKAGLAFSLRFRPQTVYTLLKWYLDMNRFGFFFSSGRNSYQDRSTSLGERTVLLSIFLKTNYKMT